MTFSKLFIIIACVLLVLVGAALGYSIKMFLQVGDMSHRLELNDYDLRALEHRIFLLESQLRIESPGVERRCMLMQVHLYDAFQDKAGKVWIVAETDGRKAKLVLSKDLDREMEVPLNVLRQKIREGVLKRLT